MTVNQLLKTLSKIAKDGYGSRPVKIMRVESGITFAEQITQCFAAEIYDGHIVWLLTDEELEPPEWMVKRGVQP